ncbi:uncharacterized protein AB675_4993 [Cyphellophora attinorum]|uniref:MARVEL domain-containing protein n=1 Tax=Cyphellophora attinorum TaxID=1664694 RepID=A0A0N1H8C8_9EURO|nr:uncharacterized protein AB675_4993 [Phialophora attinorum]KPI39320.1 hypothetical protein AB675_4993 [Phialophora attinorum]
MAFSFFLSKSTRNELSVADPRWRSKTVLHLITVNFAFVAIALFGAVVPMWNDNFFHGRGLRGDWTDGLILAPLLVSFIISCTTIITIFIQRKRLPPLFNIGALLAILFFLLIAIVFAGVGSIFPHWRSTTTPNQNGVVLCNTLNMFTRECEPMMYRIGELQIAGLIFSIIVWLTTSLLVVIAVQEWRDMKFLRKHQLRKLQLYTDPEKTTGGRPGGRTGKQIKLRNSITRMSYLRPPTKTRQLQLEQQYHSSLLRNQNRATLTR